MNGCVLWLASAALNVGLAIGTAYLTYRLRPDGTVEVAILSVIFGYYITMTVVGLVEVVRSLVR